MNANKTEKRTDSVQFWTDFGRTMELALGGAANLPPNCEERPQHQTVRLGCWVYGIVGQAGRSPTLLGQCADRSVAAGRLK